MTKAKKVNQFMTPPPKKVKNPLSDSEDEESTGVKTNDKPEEIPQKKPVVPKKAP